MHGQKREQYKARMRDPKVAAGLQHKANQWFKLNDALLKAKGSSSLELTTNMLQVNPDPAYIWTRRRKMMLADDETLDLQAELVLTQKCLERNPKAYGAWFHRKWSILQAGSDNDKVLKTELALCAQFLTLDERNFHCWNYRRFIVGLLCGSGTNGEIVLHQRVLFGRQVGGPPAADASAAVDEQKVLAILQSEFDFTTEKIEQNFSNASAFHYRAKLMPHLVSASVDTELELVHNAIFTEPDDQTAWWHLNFLLENYTDSIDLNTEKEMLEELVEAEGGQTKWGLLGLYQVLVHMEGSEEQQREILESLKSLDPDRSARYEDMLERVGKQ